MAEYIDREKLLKEIDEAIDADGLGYVVGQTMKRYLERQSAADVAPVVHGKWEWFEEEHGTIDTGWDRDWGWRCSGCKDTLNDEYDDPDNPPKHKYCPNCGAKMQDE